MKTTLYIILTVILTLLAVAIAIAAYIAVHIIVYLAFGVLIVGGVGYGIYQLLRS